MGDRFAVRSQGAPGDDGTINWGIFKRHFRGELLRHQHEAITQPPAPSHPIARGRAGPKLLAHILFAKYGLNLPLNRQSAT